MKLKNIFPSLLIIAMMVVTSCSGPTSKTAKVTVKYDAKELNLMYSGLEAFFHNYKDVKFTKGENGTFSAEVNLDAPQYYRVMNNILYLSPSDDLYLELDKNDPTKTVITGKGSEFNTYLKSSASPYLGWKTKDTSIDALTALVKQKVQERLNELSKLSNLSTELINLEKARINAEALNTLFYNMRRNKIDTEVIIDKIKPYFDKINDSKLLDVEAIRSIVYNVYTADSLFKTKLNFEAGNVEYANALKEYITLVKPDRETISKLDKYIATLTNERVKSIFTDRAESFKGVKKGLPAIDITLEDKDGNKKMLSDFKGKYLYIDFWATWCGPCKREMPYFNKLNQEIDNEDIVFISVSVDKNKDTWRKFIAEHKESTLQFNSDDKAVARKWLVNSIPRFILIDKEFNIISASATRPSNEETKKILSELK